LAFKTNNENEGNVTPRLGFITDTTGALRFNSGTITVGGTNQPAVKIDAKTAKLVADTVDTSSTKIGVANYYATSGATVPGIDDAAVESSITLVPGNYIASITKGTDNDDITIVGKSQQIESITVDAGTPSAAARITINQGGNTGTNIKSQSLPAVIYG